ncbi:ectoine/hydroxyectoine ABC transporter, permease protein EhuC [Ruegeria denitrificans]|uniref:Ectoine/hydroxyectoine ABC transporter, permease protein EhuC n=1 Tax=Ruegeria denitrificans TaxID=1715692 RepID=A0A0P1J042_9RHOB|nr:hypothetical protein [Ruegeria denitrificans]CUK18675.1 ectoine/hydroxyectoine ABC transporter, permease protein EhuC [Ruegeria denitrificans]
MPYLEFLETYGGRRLEGSLVALISVTDLMFEVRQIKNSTFLSVQSFSTALIIYYVFARFLITPFMRYFERTMPNKIGRA